jgi:hypothetical protein
MYSSVGWFAAILSFFIEFLMIEEVSPSSYSSFMDDFGRGGGEGLGGGV